MFLRKLEKFKSIRLNNLLKTNSRKSCYRKSFTNEMSSNSNYLISYVVKAVTKYYITFCGIFKIPSIIIKKNEQKCTLHCNDPTKTKVNRTTQENQKNRQPIVNRTKVEFLFANVVSKITWVFPVF